jgi:two-component system sensor histidine kinase KdpD
MAAATLLERPDDRAPWRRVAAVGSPPFPSADVADAEIPVSDTLVLLLRGSPPEAGDQRVLGAYAAQIASVLERERLAERARQARQLAEGNAIRTALLAAVSHDLRTPLASIKAAVSSLRSTDVEWSAADEGALLATIEESADRLDALVANLLDMSRLQTGSVEPHLRPVDVDEIVPAALSGLSPTARIDLSIPEELPLVVADPGLLERVLANLVENAVRHGGEGRPVLVSASALGERVEVRVVDRGPGVPDSAKETIFRPFQRLGDAPAGSGVGLGLAVAQGFTAAFGGTLTAEDTPGGGLTMVLSLPVSTPSLVAEQAPA